MDEKGGRVFVTQQTLVGWMPAVPFLLLAGALALMSLLVAGFIAAAAALRVRNTRKAKRWSALERDWGALVKRVSSSPTSVSAPAVAPRDRLYFVDYLYRSAVASTDREHSRLLAHLARPFLDAVARRATEGDSWQRARALQTVAELGEGRFRSLLVNGLDDDAEIVVLAATQALAREHPDAVGEVLNRLPRYRRWDARLLRATLTRFGASAAPAISARFADTTLEPPLRAVCAEALADLDYPYGADTAAACLGEETDTDLLASCLRLLRRTGTAAHAEMVRPLCESADPVVRAQAVAALARIGQAGDLERLKQALIDPSPWVARRAESGLEQRLESAPRPAAFMMGELRPVSGE